MGRPSNIVPEKKLYTVQINANMITYASKVFDDLDEATSSAIKIVRHQNKLSNHNTTYAMIWQGKTLVNYIQE